MTLEAAKEMDRRCVMNWLNEVYVTPSRAFDEYTEYELKMFAHDALVLLEEQKELEKRYEPVEPKEIINDFYPVEDYRRTLGWNCGKCGRILVGDGDFCSYCGQAVKWE